MKLVTAEQMRQIETIAFSHGVSENSMMNKVADAICRRVQDIMALCPSGKVTVICGVGKNGQDALLSAARLNQKHIYTSIFATSPLPHVEGLAEGFYNLTYIKDEISINQFKEELKETSLVIDGLFGTGLTRRIVGIQHEVISTLNAAHAQNEQMWVLSIDLPSGLDTDNGTIWGNCVIADETLCAGLMKIGLFQNEGPLYSGQVHVCDIGLPKDADKDVQATLIDRELAFKLLPPRSALICKNGFGKTLIISGSALYMGAPILSALGATKSGVGITTLAQPKSIYRYTANAVPFATHLPCDDTGGHFAVASAAFLSPFVEQYDGIAIGCGISPQEEASAFMWQCLLKAQKVDAKIVVDAGALTMLSERESVFELLDGLMVLTPHAGEMARLTGLEASYINENRVDVAVKYAAQWNKIILLKGPNTVVAAPDGSFYVSPYANSALAVGGSGDVLAGSIASLMAQGMSAYEACVLAVYLQGESARLCVEEHGRRGITPNEIVNYIPQVFRELEES